jgi:hypothetical protein
MPGHAGIADDAEGRLAQVTPLSGAQTDGKPSFRAARKLLRIVFSRLSTDFHLPIGWQKDKT